MLQCVALAASAFGFSGMAAGAAPIAHILFFVFLVVFLVSLFVGLGRRSRISRTAHSSRRDIMKDLHKKPYAALFSSALLFGALLWCPA